MKKTPRIGDIVWYNVGGKGHETVGLVIDVRDNMWRHKSPWEPTNKRYDSCIKIKWMRKGKFTPRAITPPIYESEWALLDMAGTSEDDLLLGRTIPAEGVHLCREWYEGRFFKVMSQVAERQR